MVSTRDDVGKIMKKRGDGSVFEVYPMNDGTVDISYSFGKCTDEINSGWDVAEDVVIKLEYSPLHNRKFSRLGVNMNGFEKILESAHAPELITYINREKGVKYVVQENGDLSTVGYFPPAKFDALRCKKQTTSARSHPNKSISVQQQKPSNSDAPGKKPDYDLLKTIRAAVPRIQKRTNIKVLLPDSFPKLQDRPDLFVETQSSSSMYKMTIGTQKNCGANACLVALLMAERNADPPSEDEVDKVLSLEKGLKGYYSSQSCGASCAPPQMQLVYDNVLYTFQFISTGDGDDVDERSILDMVNSALVND